MSRARDLSVWVEVTTLSGTAATVTANPRHCNNVTIKNVHASISVYVGPSGVTSSTGFELKAGESVSLPNFSLAGGNLYAVAASGTPDIHVIGSA